MKTSSAIVLIVLCSGAAFALGWTLNSPSTDGDPSNTEDSDAGGAKPSDEALLGTDAMQLANVQRELAEEKASHKETADRLKRLADAVGEQMLGEEVTPASDIEVNVPRYSFPKTAEVLAAVDWRATGEGVAKMGPLLVEFVETVKAGKGIPSNVGEIQRWNAPLAAMAINAQKQGVPGTGIPGVFSHPSIAVNLVDAALKQAGLPLTDAQADRLGKLGQSFVAEDERRLAGYDESTFAVRKTVEEALLKERLYQAIDLLLTEEQREILHPAAVRGRCAFDTFSSAVIWAAVCAPVKFQTREDLTQSLVRIAVQRGQIAVEHHAILQEVASEWAQSFSEDYLSEEPDALFREGIGLVGATHGLPVTRAEVAGKRAIAFYRALHERLPADATAAAHVRTTALIPVPVKWIEQDD